MRKKQHCLIQIKAHRGLNHHRAWYCKINDIKIYSNDDNIGDKFYMTNSEHTDTIWYSSPTTAAIAYNQYGIIAVNKIARCYGY